MDVTEFDPYSVLELKIKKLGLEAKILRLQAEGLIGVKRELLLAKANLTSLRRKEMINRYRVCKGCGS
jgi:hypothetical protein